jgi:succinyl-CoA synthetase beta subunit
MIAPEQLANFLDPGFDHDDRERIEQELAGDEEALRYVLGQREIDRMLHSLLGGAARHDRIKASILAAVAGASVEQLRGRVLTETSESVQKTKIDLELLRNRFKGILRTSMKFLAPALAVGLVLVW